ncbi:hypothetical protein MNB_SUP05-SYMBIONT-4-421 [hydrothermal vent metagenome]|uniref:Tlde1 domain-containing protein n=1 Tax=hydrothermal vent metagenome TaxID=652676 RepID=A0A1W1DXT4_9ZZZZ
MGNGTDIGAVISRTTIAATMGGLVAQATGGNFEDGAYQASVVHLFNHEVTFDGENVSYDDDKGKQIVKYSATSGKDGIKDQSASWKGPIPKGSYTLNPDSISKAGFFRKFMGDWGKYRAPLTPNQSTNTYGRSGFFIHGGSSPGSAGCIDMGKYDSQLFDRMKVHDGLINVNVQYK